MRSLMLRWGLVVVAVIGLTATVASLEDPLVRLERAARQIRFVDSGSPRVPDADDRYWEARAVQFSLATWLGVTVTYETEREANTGGTSSAQARTVNVDPKYHWNMRLLILAHEGGHLLQPLVDGNDSEVFADGVSFETARLLGWDTTPYVARHLAMYKSSLHVLRDYHDEIQWAATVVAGRR